MHWSERRTDPNLDKENMASQLAQCIARILALAGLAALSACSAGLMRVAPPVAPPALLHSVPEADRALAGAADERAAIEARYADAERVCYAKFFVSSCLEVAMEQHRVGLARVRAIEVDAQRFKRQAAVEARERARALGQAEADAEAARRAAQPAPVRTEVPALNEAPPRRSGTRAAEHAARLKQLAAEEAANAGKRAENVAAFEKKQRDSEQRQREVAAKKAQAVAKAEAAAKAAAQAEAQPK